MNWSGPISVMWMEIAMVEEYDARMRAAAYEAEIQRLDAEIDLRRMRVRMGTDSWRAELEHAADRAERRRILDVQLQALRWVLGADSESRTA